jgi:Zn finger protein HypA/HybF involved in hydrogenase expression
MKHISEILPTEQDCSLCEKTYFSHDIRDICPDCEKIQKAIEPTTIKASELAKKLGISFTQL